MAAKSKIGWTDATWNPIAGCDKVSEGCKHCYAIRDAHRLAGNPNTKISLAYAGTTTKGERGELKWTGRVNLLPEKLTLPLSWKPPKRIFVNAMSDLFHPAVPFSFLDRMFEVMFEASGHVFQLLTKRQDRMLEYLTNLARIDENWPYPNVWVGVSAEDEDTVRCRVEVLGRTPAAVRWISLEPYLSQVSPHVVNEYLAGPDTRIDWIVCGGESGIDASPVNPAWVYALRDACLRQAVPFNFKQWGSWLPLSTQYPRRGKMAKVDGKLRDLIIGEEVTGLAGWNYAQVPKHISGRRLDGDIWDQYPEPGLDF